MKMLGKPSLSHLPRRVPFPYVQAGRKRPPADFVSALRTAATCERAIAEAGGKVNAVEEALGHCLAEEPGNWGHVTRLRRVDIMLSQAMRLKLLGHYPALENVVDSPIWELSRAMALRARHETRERNTDGFSEEDIAGYAAALGPAVVHAIDTGFFGSILGGAIRYGPRPTDAELTRVALLGTFDAVAALWILVLRQADIDHKIADALHVARYIPPALALLLRSDEGRRVALFLFAHMRQTTLDVLRADEMGLVLHEYDLVAAARSASVFARVSEATSSGQKPCDEGEARVALIASAKAWIEANRAKLYNAPPPFDIKWSRDLSPSKHPNGDGVERLLPRFHREKQALLATALGPYF
jgi:hypothetical protein